LIWLLIQFVLAVGRAEPEEEPVKPADEHAVPSKDASKEHEDSEPTPKLD
jgi:hypothetical protein